VSVRRCGTVFKTCVHLIRTLPALQHDMDNPEDCDTTAEDHAPDALRYGFMSRPWRRPKPKPVNDPNKPVGVTFDELWEEHEQSLSHFEQL
jgi:hypothetical protein